MDAKNMPAMRISTRLTTPPMRWEAADPRR